MAPRRCGWRRRPGSRSCRDNVPRARLVDWEITAIDLRTEGLLMAPAYGIPRLLARQRPRLRATSTSGRSTRPSPRRCWRTSPRSRMPAFLRDKAGVTAPLGTFPRERMNPNGGSIALGHPFGATGARIISQAVKELAAQPPGSAGDREHLRGWRSGQRDAAAGGMRQPPWRCSRWSSAAPDREPADGASTRMSTGRDARFGSSASLLQTSGIPCTPFRIFR